MICSVMGNLRGHDLYRPGNRMVLQTGGYDPYHDFQKRQQLFQCLSETCGQHKIMAEVLARLGITDSSVIYGEMSGAIGYSLRNNLENYGTTKRCARITPRMQGSSCIMYI